MPSNENSEPEESPKLSVIDLLLDDRRIYRDPPAQSPPTPEEHAAYLARLDEEFAPLIAAEKARKAEEARKTEKQGEGEV